MWFGVAPRPETKKTFVRMCVQNMITTLGSVVNIIGGDVDDHLMTHENLNFDNG